MATEPTRSPQPLEALDAAFDAVPAEMVAEILDGELIVSPRPAAPHANAASNLVGELYAPFRTGRGGPGGWIILLEPELHLGAAGTRGRVDKVVPDLAGWRRARMPQLPTDAAIALAPDWVCEVLSDRTARHDHGKKRRIYARASIAHYWLLDPLEHTLEVDRLVEGRWREVETYQGEGAVRAEPFDAVELPLAALWAR